MRVQDAHDYRFVEMDVNIFGNYTKGDELKSLMDGYEIVTVTPLRQNVVLVTLKKAK